ncbi:MAG TPA: carbohydrate-binding domain-containing protein [Candidatus Saccharimonadales bacterium]|nr:carbohydrate-binding domain-containing protein [Candidatus Saccharimonadales bacterium]
MSLSFDRSNPRHLLSIVVVIFLLLAIPLTVILVRQSGESVKNPQAAGTRDPLKQPFASNSIWNMPIGSSASYTPASLKQHQGGVPAIDPNIIILKPTSPQTNIVYSPDAWGGGSRCSGSQVRESGVPLPSSYIIPGASGGDTPNNGAAILMSDSRTIKQNQPLTHCTSGGVWTSYDYKADVDIYGAGITGAHGGSGLSSIGGTIRLGELKPGAVIKHALEVNLDCENECSAANGGHRWPATQADSCWSSCYGGGNSNTQPGSLLAILPSVNCDTFVSTTPGKIMCHAFQDYGAYVVDSTSWDAWAIVPEQGPDGNEKDQFQSDYGFSMSQSGTGSAWAQDISKMFLAFNVVTNNSASNIGGGGTPRQPLADPIAPGGTPPPSDTTPPTVSVTAPANGATVSGASVTFSATAADNAGVSNVTFFVDGVSKATDTSSPYSTPIDTTGMINGTHTFKATATDTSNNQTSAQVTVTVNNIIISPPPPPPPCCGAPPPSPLSAPWTTNGDIGTVGVAGSASLSNGTFTIAGAGSDIWGNVDSFHFSAQDLTGDATLTARVVSQTNTNAWAKAGIMLRDSISADSMHAMLVVTPSNSVAFQYRTSTGGASANTSAPAGLNAPIYLKLVRAGNAISAFYSTAAFSSTNTGTLLGTVNIAFGNTTIKAGMAVLSHTTTATSTAVFDTVSVTKPTATPTTPVISGVSANPTTTAATVTWTTDQASNSQLYYGTTSAMGLSIQPSTATVTNHSMMLSGLNPGTTYFYQVKSTNSANLTGQSAVLSFKTAAVVASGSVIEAENMTLISGSDADPFTDATASGGKAMVLWKNGGLTTPLSGSGNAIVLRIYGDQCSGAPNMNVTLNGGTIYSGSIGVTTWTDYTIPVTLAATNTLNITFTNDYYPGSCDRNLRVDKVTVSSATVTSASLEAETGMKVTSGWVDSLGNVFTDAAASGGKGLIMWGNGTTSGQLASNGTKLTVRARADVCTGGPHMVVTDNGTKVIDTTISATNYTDFTGTLASSATHSIVVSFDNDLWQSATGCDRNIRLDKISIQ